jgi:hypothetical protein
MISPGAGSEISCATGVIVCRYRDCHLRLVLTPVVYSLIGMKPLTYHGDGDDAGTAGGVRE